MEYSNTDKKNVVCGECVRLQKENKLMGEKIKLLESKLEFLLSHPTIANGIKGESIVKGLTKLKKTEGNKSFDLFSHELKIEVKFSRKSINQKGKKTMVWAWGKTLGSSGKKDYDRLILVGESDERYSNYYAEPESPFVIFDLSREDARIFSRTGGSAKNIIKIVTNPNTQKNKNFFEIFNISSSELKRRYENENQGEKIISTLQMIQENLI